MSSQHDADTRNELFFLFDFNRNACDNELIDCCQVQAFCRSTFSWFDDYIINTMARNGDTNRMRLFGAIRTNGQGLRLHFEKVKYLLFEFVFFMLF